MIIVSVATYSSLQVIEGLLMWPTVLCYFLLCYGRAGGNNVCHESQMLTVLRMGWIMNICMCLSPGTTAGADSMEFGATKCFRQRLRKPSQIYSHDRGTQPPNPGIFCPDRC